VIDSRTGNGLAGVTVIVFARYQREDSLSLLSLFPVDAHTHSGMLCAVAATTDKNGDFLTSDARYQAGNNLDDVPSSSKAFTVEWNARFFRLGYLGGDENRFPDGVPDGFVGPEKNLIFDATRNIVALPDGRIKIQDFKMRPVDENDRGEFSREMAEYGDLLSTWFPHTAMPTSDDQEIRTPDMKEVSSHVFSYFTSQICLLDSSYSVDAQSVERIMAFSPSPSSALKHLNPDDWTLTYGQRELDPAEFSVRYAAVGRRNQWHKLSYPAARVCDSFRESAL
jgi:hypothetical protein